MPEQATYAISMGDIVHSSAYEDPARLHRLFNLAVAQANERFAASIISPLTITLGDEFQGLSASLRRAFELNHFVRLRLLQDGISTRLVLGLGAIDTAVNPQNAWNMMGPGLVQARDKLNQKASANCYRFSLPHDKRLERLLDSVGASMTKVESDWTTTQLEYVSRKLSEPDKSAGLLASELGISRNSLYKVLRSAEWDFYLGQLLTIIEVLDAEDDMRAA